MSGSSKDKAISFFKRATNVGDDGVDLAWRYTKDPRSPGTETRTYNQTPSVIDSGIVGEVSRDTNTDGRAEATFFNEFARENEQDVIEHPIPDQLTGPPLHYNQKTSDVLAKLAFMNEQRQLPETTQTPPNVAPSPERSPVEIAWDGFGREKQLNLSKTMDSSFKDSPRGKAEAVCDKLAKLRPRVDVFIHNDQGKVLVGKSPHGNPIFPGGGLDGKENATQAAKRESLEEVAHKLTQVKAVAKPVKIKWTPEMKKEQGDDRQKYDGVKTFFRVAKTDGKNYDLHGADGDFKMKVRFEDVAKVLKRLDRSAKKDHPYQKYDEASAKALRAAAKKLGLKVALDKSHRGIARDGHSVGFFIPIPKRIAAQFPDKSDVDDTPAHVTFLIVGTVHADREAELQRIAMETLRGLGPITATLGSLRYQVTPGGKQAAVLDVSFSRSLETLRQTFVQKLQLSGFTLPEKELSEWHPHATLAYQRIGDTYEGPIPTGSWTFNIVQLWGLPTPVEFSFNTAAQTGIRELPEKLGAIARAFELGKAAASSACGPAFIEKEDLRRAPEEILRKEESDPFKEEELSPKPNSRDNDQSWREFDAPLTQPSHNYDASPALEP